MDMAGRTSDDRLLSSRDLCLYLLPNQLHELPIGLRVARFSNRPTSLDIPVGDIRHTRRGT